MIIETILNGIVFVLLGVISLFPALPVIRFDFLDGVMETVMLVDAFLSLRVLSVCFGVIFLLGNAHLIWSVIMWVVRKIPGIS